MEGVAGNRHVMSSEICKFYIKKKKYLLIVETELFGVKMMKEEAVGRITIMSDFKLHYEHIDTKSGKTIDEFMIFK